MLTRWQSPYEHKKYISKDRPQTEYHNVKRNVLSETTDENSLKKKIYLMSQIKRNLMKASEK